MRMTFLVLSVAFVAAPAFAETRAEEAKKHFNRSKELYDDGDFSGALNELERAYTAVPNFKLMYNIGQMQAQLQNYAAALRSFRKFLVDGGSDITDSRRAEVLREIDKFRTRVAELSIVCREGAEISVDDVAVGTAPLSEPITVNVGRRKVTATLANHFPATRFVEVVGLDAVNVRLDLQAVVSQVTATNTSPPSELKREPIASAKVAEVARPLPVWVAWAGVGALGIATGVFGGLAFDSSKAQTTLLGTYGATRVQVDAASSKTRSLALVTDVLAGCTAAAGIGALLYTVFRPADPPAAVTLGVSSNSVFVSGSF